MIVQLSKETFDTLGRHAAADWDRDTACEIRALYGPYFDALEAEIPHIEELCRIIRDYAAAYEISERRGVFKMVVIALTLGAHFCHDPRHKNLIAESLQRLKIPSERRLALLSKEVEALLSSRKADEKPAEFGKRLADLLDQPPCDDKGIPAALASLLSVHPKTSDTGLESFVSFCLQHCNGYGLREPGQRLAYCACAFTHGIYWFDDPLFHKLRGEMASAVSAQKLSNRIGLFYRRFT